ncbi:unannotated protein [freshwater metagenome]|uniref:Unannotated protein n=1 Tax=freshwater metagenome TaxID=449393 RepID=A0A6J7JUQ7_9ZZZZ|nr:phage tail protein [Actinomycetota bacterium]
MPYLVDFVNVSNQGLESASHVEALAGLRANEARYFKNKYNVDFITDPASAKPELVGYVNRVLAERDIHFASNPLEVTDMLIEGVRWTYVFYESGLAVNVLYALEDGGKRAVGFKLSMGMEIPIELASKFKFVRQKSKLAGEIRGSYFVIKGKY